MLSNNQSIASMICHNYSLLRL